MLQDSGMPYIPVVIALCWVAVGATRGTQPTDAHPSFQPKSAEQLLEMLANGNKNRTQHPTDANATSSRSHAVFQVRAEL